VSDVIADKNGGLMDKNLNPRSELPKSKISLAQFARLATGAAIVLAQVTTNVLGSTPVWTAESNQANSLFGYFVNTVGDVNRDGYSDLYVNAPSYDNGEHEEGRAFVYYGSSGGLSTAPDWIGEGNQSGAEYGNRAGAAGDVNGDGYGDAIVAAYLFDGPQADEGRAYVYHGSATGLSASPSWIVESDQEPARIHGVSRAGDVNGDGYGDVIVGAQNYTNGELEEGRAWIYPGSSAGLSTTPVWMTEGNQVSAFFGSSVSTAGDVNGDGFADILVGAHFYDNDQRDEGRAFGFFGSAGGMDTVPDWVVEGDQAGAFLGFWVGTAGDVNGDGYSDVLAAAPYFDNGQVDEGRVYIYYGSSDGLHSSPDWFAEGDQSFASFGYSVGPAGDVNGDNYSDLIVGAPFYDNAYSDAGRIYVFLGSATGLGNTPDWILDGDQAGAWFGTSVNTAGDVDGDGLDEVAVGARYFDNGEADEGRAFVYAAEISNRPPTVKVVGSPTVGEGGQVLVTATGADPDGDTLTYAWDQDGDGIFETPGQSMGFSAAALDGPSDHLIRVQAMDPAGLRATYQATVSVLNIAPVIAPIVAALDPVAVNTPIDTSAEFADPGVHDTHRAYWDWGDGSVSAGTLSEANGSGSVSGGHVYANAGVYTLQVTVTDDDDDSDNELFRYVVVYDPSAGFVTGGGWISSPVGAYAPDPNLAGRSNFGFVSRYQQGASTPTGATEFQFRMADLNFHSTSYQWLVIAGAKAQYKGSGTINATGDYGFMLTAVDGQISGGGGVDKFRIKIWDKVTGQVVYDNQMGAGDGATPTTAIQGGNIVIHK
jgi:hypothetical protein